MVVFIMRDMKIYRLLLFMLSALFSLAVSAQDDTWNGSLDIQGTKLPLVFHFGTDGCTMDSPSQGAKGIPAVKDTTADGSVRVSVPAIGAIFVGKKVGNNINGTFTQNGMALPLVLTPGAPAVNRPQTPVPPFPYTEEEVTFVNDGFTFGGTLVKPAHCDKNTPVVLMITGSGLQNRDEEIFEHKPFAVIADALARQGVASLRYDDRGYGMEGFKGETFTTTDFMHDAQAAMKLLRKQFNKVGILGHSEGGTIALMMASEGEPDFVVTLAAMAVSGKETLVEQNRIGISAMGLPDNLVKTYSGVVEKALDALAAGKSIEDISMEGVPGNFKPVLEAALKPCDTPYFRHFLNIDVRKSLGKVKCPVLALNGTMDKQVNCEQNMGALKEGLTNCNSQTKTFEGLNHLFQHCTTGSVVEYQQIEETISPEVLQTIVDWVKTIKAGSKNYL